MLLFSLLYSVNAVVLTPGIHYDLTISDSDKGIGWKEIEIYAKTTINAGDQIIVNSSLFNLSSNYEWLFLKVFDENINVCSNPIMNTHYSLPNCITSTERDIFGVDNYTLTFPEQINLFQTKKYDLVFGINSRSEFKIFSNREFFTIANYSDNNITQINELLETSYADLFTQPTSQFQTTTNKLSFSSIFKPYLQLKVLNAHNLGYLTTIQSYYSGYTSGSPATFSMTDSPGNINLPIQGSYYSCSGTTAYLRIEPNTAFRNFLSNYKISGDLLRGSIGKISGDVGLDYFYMTSHYAMSSCGSRSEGYIRYIKVSENKNFLFEHELESDYCKIKENGFIIDTQQYKELYCFNNSLVSKLNYSGIMPTSYGSISLSYDIGSFTLPNSINHQLHIDKESTKPLTNAVVVPYQTNSAYPNFVNLKEEDGSTLWFKLYDLNSPQTITEIKDYLQDGENKIILDQVNEDGGYWLFFEGQYNTKPVVQGTVISNTTTFRKSTQATCSGGTYFDADGDLMSQEEYAWFRNGVLETTSATINLATSTFAKGNTIRCGKRYNDGVEWGEWVYSTEYIVQDTAPTINVTITPEDPQPSDDLTCSFSDYFDLDGDTLISQTISWLENGSVLNSSSGTTVFLSNSAMQNDKIYECRVQLNQAGASHNVSKFATLINLPPELTGIKTPGNTYSNYVSINQFCTGEDINNDQLYWTFQYTTDLLIWNNIIVNSTSNDLNWNVSLLTDNTYYLRCKANDGYFETNYSDIVSVNIVNFQTEHVKSNKAFYSTKLTLESSSPSNMNQYTSGTIGTYCGDFNGQKSECYFYTPVRFDGSKNLYYIEINPYQFYESGKVYQKGFTQNVYDLMIYEVSNIGDIPITSPIMRKTGNTFEINKANRINLNVIPDSNMYVAVKVCVNSNLLGECGIIDNGGDDLIFLYTKASGSYIMKTRQGQSTALTQYDPNIAFNWQDTISDNLRIEVNELYGDALLEPMLIKNSEGKDICVNPKIASYYPNVNSECITKKENSFDLKLDEISKAKINEYEILWGKELTITGTSYNDALIKSSTPTSEVKMLIYGLKDASNSNPSNVKLVVNGNNVWNYPSSLNSRETINSVKTTFNNLLNSMVWTTNTPGKIIYHFEPHYVNFSVIAPDRIEPINNGISPLRINITTNMEINPTLSYCKIEGNNVNIQTSTFVQTAVGVYKCEPSLEFSNTAGSYKWTVHIQDSNGQLRSTDGFFTFGNLESFTVTNLNFGKAKLENNTEDLRNTLLLENTGNTIFNKFGIDVIEDKFWDSDGVRYFTYKDKIGYAPTKAQLDSVRYFQKLDFTKENEIYNGSLNPGSNIETWWKLQVDRTIKEGSYTSKWLLNSEGLE